MGKRGPCAGMSDGERFLRHVDQRGDDECWPWLASKDPVWGYGQFRLAGRLVGAHCAAYTLFVGPIPDGFEVDHVAARGCVRRDCVNWRHLEAVPPAENRERYWSTHRKLSVPSETMPA